jgi:hypothetical protein
MLVSTSILRWSIRFLFPLFSSIYLERRLYPLSTTPMEMLSWPLSGKTRFASTRHYDRGRPPVHRTSQWDLSALGFTVCCSQDLKFGEFAIPDRAASSNYPLRNRINSSELMQGFIVKTPKGKTIQIGSCESWDPKKELQRAINA